MYTVVCALLCGCLPLAAQQAVTSATLGGRVEDRSGGSVAGASVTVRSRERGQSSSVRTDARGRFQFLRLAPGDYDLSVRDPRFEAYDRLVALSIGQAADVTITLGLSGVSQSIEVTDSAASLEIVRTQLSGSVGRTAVDSLPLNGRNYLDLALLVPGVSRTNLGLPQQFPETSAVPGSGISISGQRNLNNNFVLDGLSANDDAADLAGTFFSQEVIREFQVVVSGANAEFGRASSGVVNIASRSGTNEWHGRLYGYLRNQRFDARNALAAGKDPLTQIQYGASAGGPLARDRTFLFANFEAASRNAAGFITITPANVGAINTAMDAFGIRSPRISTGEFATGHDSANGFLRIDHRAGRSHQLAARYNAYDIASANARGVGNLSAVSRGTGLENRDQTLAFMDVATISPHTLNEARLQFTRSRLGAPGNDLVGPSIGIAGVANFGAATGAPVRRDNDLFEAADTWSSLRGRHFVKAGGNLLYNRLAIDYPGSKIAAVYTFANLAAFQAGRYTTFQQSFGETVQSQSNPNGGAFVQDEWRAADRLTLTMGLRYDVQKLASPIRTNTRNFAPRFGAAWSPGGRRTVVRAAYGIYFDRIPLRATSNALQRDGSKYRTALLAFGQEGAPSFPAQLPAFPQGQYINITTIDPNISNSYSHQASVQVERAFGRTTLSAGYNWLRSLHLILSRNANVPALPAVEAAARGIPNLGRPDPRYGNVSRYEGGGDSYYNGMTASVRTRLWKASELRLSYNLSKAIDDVGNAFFNTPQDNFNLRDDRSLSDNDQRHRVTAAAVFDFRGFTLAPLFQYTSALPYNTLLNYDRNNDTNLNDRPFGVGRNTNRGFNYATFDVRLARRFRIHEQWSAEALVEAFNLFNRVNFAVPNNVIGSGAGAPLPAFGRPTGVFDARQLQLGLRVGF